MSRNVPSRSLVTLCLPFIIAVQGCAQTATVEVETAESVHDRLLTLDTHLDAPVHFSRPGWSFGDRHTAQTDIAQLDIPRMRDGHLDGGFFVIFTDQGELSPDAYEAALEFALNRSSEIDAMLEQNSNEIGLALSVEDALRLHDDGKLIGFKSMENSYPLGTDLKLAERFYEEGLRMAGPVHSSSNQLADSASGDVLHGGLSDLGRDWVSEMNRLGIIIDASHASDAAFDQMIDLSTAPIILSHSGIRGFYDHPRNLDENRVRKLSETGGAICVSAIFLSPLNMTEDRAAAWAAFDRFSEMSEAEQAELNETWQALNKSDPIWSDNLDRFMDALLYTIDIAGVDHVCIGMDWDGGGGFEGLEDITDNPDVTRRLLEAGYSELDVAKIWSGNVLRIMTDVEAAASRSD